MGPDAPLSDISDEAKQSFEVAVRPVPQYDPENMQMISQGPSVCVFYKEDPQEVLASWLFTQYLLTSDVQISYSETEGYVPVTSKAQSPPNIRIILRGRGEDTDTHYKVKIEAAKLFVKSYAGYVYNARLFRLGFPAGCGRTAD